MKDHEEFKYTGTDNLEVMIEAVNYNNYLSRLVQGQCASSVTIVDFGAGIGTFAAPLHRSGKAIIAVEPDQKQQERLTAQGIRNVGDIAEIENEWADTIYSINVLEHIEDDIASLAMIRQKLTASGKVFIYVPAFQILFSSMDVKVKHFRRYRKNDLAKKLTAANLEIIELRYADSLGFIASLAFKYIGNNSGDLNITAVKIYDRIIFPLSKLLDNIVSPFFGKNLIAVAKRKT